LNILLGILYFIGMVVFIISGILLLKKFVFGKVTINKYIPLIISILILGTQIILGNGNKLVNSALTVIAVLFFAWFWDINETGSVSSKKEKVIKMRPKAKPNRVKNRK
jgi:hypothetical protein